MSRAAHACDTHATPEAGRTLAPPLRRFIGDLSDRERVPLGLDVRTRR